MTIFRHRRGQPGEETPFIELLFVAVGSLAMLMLVFLAAAARPPPAPSCDSAAPDDETRIANEISQWATAAREKMAQAQREVDRRCRAQAATTNSASPPPAVLPAELAKYCRLDQERIIAKAGTTREELERLGRRYQAIARAASDCLGKQLTEPRGCIALSAGEGPRAAASIKKWAEATRLEIDATKRDVARRCKLRVDDVDNTTTGMLPADLAEYCRPDQDRILGQAGLRLDEVQLLSRQQLAAARAVFRCLGEQRIVSASALCPQLSEAELSKIANDVQKWWNEEKMVQAALQETATRLCGDSRAITTRTFDPGAAPGPPMLQGFCQNETSRILERAKLTRAQLSDIGNPRRSVAAAISECGQGTEPITLSSTTVRFDTCSADIVTTSDFFPNTAREVWKRLGTHNRIDILGHSDSTPIRSAGCRVNINVGGQPLTTPYLVYTNEMLSWLRANSVRNALVRAIDTNPELLEFQGRLKGNSIRIYTIGVGNAEPRSTLLESRRIEIRFATDNRAASARGNQ